MRQRVLDAADAAVENDGEARVRGLQPIDAPIIERRHLAVLLRRQAVEPGLAGVHDERVGAGLFDGLRKNFERVFRVLVVDADAALHRDRHRDGRFHRGHAVAHERGLRHQTSAEAAVLHPVGGAADIEVDRVEAQVRADARTRRKRPRLGAAELQRQRMLGRIEAQQPCAVAVQHRAGGQHFGV